MKDEDREKIASIIDVLFKRYIFIIEALLGKKTGEEDIDIIPNYNEKTDLNDILSKDFRTVYDIVYSHKSIGKIRLTSDGICYCINKEYKDTLEFALSMAGVLFAQEAIIRMIERTL